MTETWHVYDGAVLHGPYVFRSDAVEAAKHLLRHHPEAMVLCLDGTLVARR